MIKLVNLFKIMLDGNVILRYSAPDDMNCVREQVQVADVLDVSIRANDITYIV